MTSITELSESLARRIVRARRPVAILLAVACLGGGWGLSRFAVTGSMEAYVDETDEEVRFFRASQETFGDFDSLIVLIQGPEQRAGAVDRHAVELRESIGDLPGVVEAVGGPDGDIGGRFGGDGLLARPPPDGNSRAVIVAAVDRRAAAIQDRVEIGREVRALANRDLPEGVNVHVAGFPAIALDAMEQTREDLFSFLWLMPLFFGAILIAVYRMRRCVLVPPVIITVSLVICIGLFSGAGMAFDMVSIAFPVVIAVVSFTDLIHILHRYHVEVRNQRQSVDGKAGEPRADETFSIVLRTMRPMNIACFMTSLTTATGFVALSFSPVEAVATFATWTAIAIMITYVVVILLAPILLYLLPQPSDRDLDGYFDGIIARGLQSIPRFAYSHVVPVAFLCIAVLSVFGMTRIHVESEMRGFLPDDLPSVVAAEKLEGTALAGEGIRVVVHSSGEGFDDPGQIRRLANIQGDLLEAFPETISAFSIVDALRAMSEGEGLPDTDVALEEAMLRMSLSVDERWLGSLLSDDRASALIRVRIPADGNEETVELLQSMDRWLDERAPDGWTMRTTGTPKLYALHNDMLPDTLRDSLLLTILIIALVLFAFFRNTVLTTIALAANLLPVMFTLGIMGMLETGMNMTSMMTGSILLALAVDDTIHFIASFREHATRGQTKRGSIRGAIDTSGFAIVVSSLVLIGGFAVLLFAGLAPMRNFGLMMTLGVLAALAVNLSLLVYLLDRARLGRDRVPAD